MGAIPPSLEYGVSAGCFFVDGFHGFPIAFIIGPFIIGAFIIGEDIAADRLPVGDQAKERLSKRARPGSHGTDVASARPRPRPVRMGVEEANDIAVTLLASQDPAPVRFHRSGAPDSAPPLLGHPSAAALCLLSDQHPAFFVHGARPLLPSRRTPTRLVKSKSSS